MQITAYNFAKEPNSTKQPIGGRNITCTLKDDCSIMHPVFLLTGWQMSDNYIKWGSRYYWIEDIVVKTKDHAEYHCREDVLASFKSAIGTSSQYILRSSHAYTGNLIDAKYPALTGVTKVETELNTLHSAVVSDGFYVVGIQNGETAGTRGITYYALGPTQFANLVSFMFGGTWLDTTETNVTLALQKELINPMQYISSIIWYPFSTDIYGSFPMESIKFGWWSGSGVAGSVIPQGSLVQIFSEQVNLPRHPNAASRGSYLNGLPFTRHTLFCYNFGQIPIDANLFSESSTCIILLTVDLGTGDAKLAINDGSAHVNMIMPGKMGQQIQISQLSQSLIAPLMNVISGSVGIAYGNVVGYGQGIISGIESMMPQATVKGGSDSRLWYYKKPTILTEHKSIASEDNAHLGRPLCVRGTVSSYPGYMEVENADIDFACNYSELTEIKSFMEGGFYYE